MSFLGRKQSNKKSALSLRTNIYINTSGNKHVFFLPNFGQKYYQKSSNSFLKRMSLDTSLYNRGSLTIEAALVIPIFLFAIISILSFCEILRFQTKVDSSLQNITKTMAVYSYGKELAGDFMKDTDIQIPGGIGNMLSEMYVHHKVVSDLGSDYISKSPVQTSSNIYFLGSKFTDDKIEIRCTYLATPFFMLSPKARITTGDSVVAKVFNGYNNLSVSDKDKKEEIVYITEYGTAYHRSIECHYLDLSITSVAKGSVSKLRNESGGKYKVCPYCGKGATGNVYITKYGDRYHTDLLCRGLKRMIKAVPISQVGGRSPCSKCG